MRASAQEFSGTYDTEGGTVFGQTGAAVPYNYQITYDTSLDTNPFFFGTGVAMGAETTTHEWHGYSASGVIATSLIFGTGSWTAADLQPRTPAAGVTADLWFDTDLSVAAPTLALMQFLNGSGFLSLGTSATSSGNIFIKPGSGVEDESENTTGKSTELTIVASQRPTGVPDAGSTLPLLGLALGAMAWYKRRQPN